MTTLTNLSDAPIDAAENDLFFTRPTTGPANAKRSFGSLWRNVLGRTAAAQRAFFGAVPVTQPSGATQAAVIPTIGVSVATTPASNGSPFGYTTQAQADRIVTLLNETRTDVIALTTLVNKMRADLVALGLLKGSA